MLGYAQEISRTQFFVGLRIEVDAPGILAAIRPCKGLSTTQGEDMNYSIELMFYTLIHFSQCKSGDSVRRGFLKNALFEYTYFITLSF